MKTKEMYSIIIPILIIIDQAVKQTVLANISTNTKRILIKNLLNITYLENTGVAYGIGSKNTILVIVLNILIILSVIYVILFRKNKIDNTELIGLYLIVAGGTSNLIDRIIRGYVIDYIDINDIINFPVFNLADICVVFGTILILITSIRKIGEE